MQNFARMQKNIDPLGEHGLVPKIIRTNVFPMFLFCVFVIIYLVLKRVVGNVVYPILNKTIGKIFRCFVGAAKSISIKPLTSSPYQQLPPYTGEYRQFVGKSYVVSAADTMAGWKVDSLGTLYRIWTKETENNGVKRKAGEHRLTWEALRAPVKSYAIASNKKYTNAAARIQEIKNGSK